MEPRSAAADARLTADDLEALGLGLAHGCVELAPTQPAWVLVGRRLADQVRAALGGLVVDLEPIGSTSVVGLLAKPVIDLAASRSASGTVASITGRLRADWIYRGDAGDQGGDVFVLESAPGRRVAHLHIVDPDGPQWHDYRALRELLRRDERARSAYGAVKTALRERFGDNSARDYTTGKSAIVAELLLRARTA